MIELPPEFEADIQGQNLNLFPIVTIDTFDPDPSLTTDSGAELQVFLYGSNVVFVHDGAWDVFNIGDYVKIDDEYMRVTDTLTNSVYVTRGLLGSNIEDHDVGADIYIIYLYELNISTKNVTLSNVHYKPLLLNIPSIKESMDFENRNYKISNVSLKVSNYEYEGEQFSDYVGNLINNHVSISWVSQSESILLVYDGFIRRYFHDDKTATLQLEDSSQKDLHTNVPVAKLGDGPEIPDKYKNKPIPLVYGEVENSPVVVVRDVEQNLGDIHCFVDNVEGVPGVDAIEVDSIVGEHFGFEIRMSWLKLAEDGVVSHLLNKAWEPYMTDLIDPAPAQMESEQKLQFTIAESGKVTGHIFSIPTGAIDHIYNPLFHGLCNAIQVDRIEHDDEYGVEIKQSAINVNLPDIELEIEESDAIWWPTSPLNQTETNWTQIYNTTDQFRRTFLPMQAEMWNNSPLNCNGNYRDTYYNARSGRICIAVSEPLEQANQNTHYQSVMWALWDSRAVVSGVSNPNGYYGYVTCMDVGLGFENPDNNYFLWIPPDTLDGTEIEGYGSSVTHSKYSFKREKPSELTVFVDAPLLGKHTIDSFQFKVFCKRSYWVKDPFSHDLFAHVKGRKDTLYGG